MATAKSLYERASRKNEAAYDRLVTDKALLPKALSKTYVQLFQKRIGRGTKIAVIKSETTMPHGWDYGNYTVLKITLPNGDDVNAAISLNIADKETSGNVSVDHAYGGTIGMGRGGTPEKAIQQMMSDAASHLAASGAKKNLGEDVAVPKNEAAYDRLITDKAQLPKALSKSYVQLFQKRIGRGTKIKVVKSETTKPEDWDYGNYTVLAISLPNGDDVNAAISLNVSEDPWPGEATATTRVDHAYGSVGAYEATIGTGRGATPEKAIQQMMRDAASHLAAAGAKKLGEADVDLQKLGKALHHWHWDQKDQAYKLGLALQGGRKPSAGAVKKVRDQLQKLADGNPSKSFWGNLQGGEAKAELRWVIQALGQL